jgi:hypothetical protein
MKRRSLTARPPSLAALFTKLSRSHFEGRVDGYSVRRLPLTPRSVELLRAARPEGHLLASCKIWRREIRVLGFLRFRPVLERRALLHEMCHAATEQEAFAGLPHGPQWRAEMLRLAFEHGETWAAPQAIQYAREADGETEAAYVAALEEGSAQIKVWAASIRRMARLA